MADTSAPAVGVHPVYRAFYAAWSAWQEHYSACPRCRGRERGGMCGDGIELSGRMDESVDAAALRYWDEEGVPHA